MDSTCIVCNGEVLLLELTRSFAVRTANTTDHNSSSEANISSARNFPHFMEFECSLPCSQNTATCPYPPILRQMNSVYELPSSFLTIHFNINRPSNPRSSEWSLSFPTQTPYVLFCSAICDIYLCWYIQRTVSYSIWSFRKFITVKADRFISKWRKCIECS